MPNAFVERHVARPFDRLQFTGLDALIPVIKPWSCDRGRLLDALAVCGAVYITDDGAGRLPHQHFASWRNLWQEAADSTGQSFRQRQCVQTWQLRFSQGEDLLRTVEGGTKTHIPDLRYNFGAGHHVLLSKSTSWGDLEWIVNDFRTTFHLLTDLIRQELEALVSAEPSWTLGARVRSGSETWAGTRLRHSVYPPNGSCTEHTDYGVVTMQQSTTPGLHGFVNGQWHPIQPTDGYALLFAGDMLERLTNGEVSALRHRVCIDSPSDETANTIVRQAHIIFLQPDKNTIVQPLRHYCRGDGTDLAPIKYGDWHATKTSLAFDKY